jgi:hypothetical protein
MILMYRPGYFGIFEGFWFPEREREAEASPSGTLLMQRMFARDAGISM